jgi:DNA-binding response OmpR family regulator
MIIEDDPALNQIFTISLKNDFETEAFTDGRDALSRLEQVIPSMVVLDLHLPGAPGREILAKIRGDDRLSHTRIILATADDRQADMLNEKADIVLLKPISPGQLKDLAKRLCTNC